MKKNTIKWIPFKQLEKEFLKDPDFKKAYDALEVEHKITVAVMKRRIEKKMTQTQLANKLGTKQPVISRLEQGTLNPSVSFLKRVAKALDAKLEIKIS